MNSNDQRAWNAQAYADTDADRVFQRDRAEKAEAERDQLRVIIDRVTERLRTDDPRAMINQRQVLGLLSPTWPDGNYEAPAPSDAKEPTA